MISHSYSLIELTIVNEPLIKAAVNDGSVSVLNAEF